MAKKIDKYELVIRDLLARITNYQLQSMDNNYLDNLEDLREEIVQWDYKRHGKENTRNRKNQDKKQLELPSINQDKR